MCVPTCYIFQLILCILFAICFVDILLTAKWVHKPSFNQTKWSIEIIDGNSYCTLAKPCYNSNCSDIIRYNKRSSFLLHPIKIVKCNSPSITYTTTLNTNGIFVMLALCIVGFGSILTIIFIIYHINRHIKYENMRMYYNIE